MFSEIPLFLTLFLTETHTYKLHKLSNDQRNFPKHFCMVQKDLHHSISWKFPILCFSRFISCRLNRKYCQNHSLKQYGALVRTGISKSASMTLIDRLTIGALGLKRGP